MFLCMRFSHLSVAAFAPGRNGRAIEDETISVQYIFIEDV